MTSLDTAQNLLKDRKIPEALAAFDALLAQAPDEPQALFGRATAFKLMGRLAEARRDYDAVLAKIPDAIGALNNRGEVLNMLGLPDKALADFAHAVTLRPDFPSGYLGRGIALVRLNRPEEALQDFDKTLALWPDLVDGHFYRALVLAQLGQAEDAIAAYDKVIARTPDSFAAVNNRAVALHALRRFTEAARGYEALEKLVPGHAAALHGMAACALHACDWSHRNEFRERLAAAVRAGRAEIQPGTMLGYSGDRDLLLACARNFARAAPPAPVPLWRGRPFSGKRIKIAYCSGDFCSHAMPRLMAGLFERHDREKFEVLAFSWAPDDQSPMRARLEKAFDGFIDVRLSGEQAIADRIAGMNVDIAVDLMGYTQNARTGIFAARPAPVQVNYMGFPGTLGASYYDYIIGDRIVTPLEHQPGYTETLMPLADSYLATDDRREAAGTAPSRAEAGLPDKGFVFCCFNNNWKITASLFNVWMRLLKAVPDSVLWLLEDSADAADNLRRAAAARDVETDRLVFAPRVSPADHLARHRLADLFLDTQPYNAHTTAADALWVGVPVVTAPGTSFHGRVAASVVTAMGLPELAAENLEAYEALALSLARDGARLAALRKKLDNTRATAPLFDTARFTRAMEAAYESMRDVFLKN